MVEERTQLLVAVAPGLASREGEKLHGPIASADDAPTRQALVRRDRPLPQFTLRLLAKAELPVRVDLEPSTVEVIQGHGRGSAKLRYIVGSEG